jgi:hypothetical protein
MHGRIAFLCMLGLACLSLLAPSRSGAVTLETLVMPGKVSNAHAKLEKTCGNCHDRTNQVTQSSLCVACHKDVAEDLKSRVNFHGRMANAGSGECRACHTEHKGRDADITQLNKAQFDHSQTQFALQGAHASLDCASCHKSKEAWRKATPTCVGCHKADDVHKGQFSQSCGECHGANSWTGGKFDHDKAQFHLTGAHVSITCDACHVGGRYKPLPKSCIGCHATDDEHRGSRGPDCAKCHTTKEWKSAKYDHLKETGYALLGVHVEISCLACHKSGNYKEKIPKDCDGCHRADDSHAHRFGVKCDTCHGNDRWHLSEYDHLERHKFALVGAHAKLDCHTCHVSDAAKKLPEDCAGCHAGQNPHADKVTGKCADCHGQDSWRAGMKFDHDLSSFPLLGLHRVVSCVQCHADQKFALAPATCNGCHARNDVHKGGLGVKCESCHSPNGWSLWTFDHARDAHFALLGAHAKQPCGNCHTAAPGTQKMSQECVSCHRKDDRHLGQYGAQCDRCHSSYSWKGARTQ